MGFYDASCAITGVSLLGSRRVALVLLERRGRPSQQWTPIAGPLVGVYDRYGAIDGVIVDPYVRSVLAFFQRSLADGTYVVRWEDMPMARGALSTVDELLRTVERGVTQGYTSAALDGVPIGFTLVDAEVWAGAVAAGAGGALDRTGVVAARLTAEGAAAGLDPEAALAPVARVDRFLRDHRLAWAPTRSDGQHDLAGTVPRRLARARARWGRVPAIDAALDRYADQVPGGVSER